MLDAATRKPDAAPEPLLEVRGLRAFYGRAQILFDIALSVARGEVVALMGRNGAGKSTTLKAFMGLVEARAEAIRFKGRDIAGWPPFRIAPNAASCSRTPARDGAPGIATTSRRPTRRLRRARPRLSTSW